MTIHISAGLYAYPNPSGEGGFTIGWPAGDFEGQLRVNLFGLDGTLLYESTLEADATSIRKSEKNEY